MIGLMMAGGRSSRMGPHPEKLTLGGRIPVAQRVISALISCPAIDNVVAAVSPQAPGAMEMLAGRIDIIKTPGDGYSVDLAYALQRLQGPVLSVPADLPLLDADILNQVAAEYAPRYWTTITISEGYAARLGFSPGILVDGSGIPLRYTGVSTVHAGRPGVPTRHVTMNDYRLAANMNTPADWVLLGAAQYLAKDYGL